MPAAARFTAGSRSGLGLASSSLIARSVAPGRPGARLNPAMTGSAATAAWTSACTSGSSCGGGTAVGDSGAPHPVGLGWHRAGLRTPSGERVQAGEGEHRGPSVPSDQGGQHHLAVLVPLGRGAVDQDRDHRYEQACRGERGQRRLLTALPGLVGGQCRGHPGIGRAAVIAELLPARIEVARHVTDLTARTARPRLAAGGCVPK